MRVAVAKSDRNWVLLPRTIMYEDLPKDEKIFDLIRDLPHLGLVLGLEADFYVLGAYDKLPIGDYDVIIKLDRLPQIKAYNKDDKLICYEPGEPFQRQWTPGVFHVMLDNFITEADNLHLREDHIPWTYRYPVDLMRSHIVDKKDEPHVFVQKRTILHKEPEHVRGEAFGIRPFRSYFKYLSECKYLFNLDENESAGQISAEAAIMDVLSFGNPIKPLQRLIFPDVCDATDEDELWFLLKEFEDSEDMYREAIKIVRENVYKYLDCKNMKRDFLEKVIGRNG